MSFFLLLKFSERLDDAPTPHDRPTDDMVWSARPHTPHDPIESFQRHSKPTNPT